MPPEWTVLTITFQALRCRLERAGHDQETGVGTVEAVVLVALLVSIAIAVGAVIRSRIVDKANSIPLG